MRLGTVATAALSLAAGVHAIAKVTRAGRYLYTDDGNRFYIKGVAYQEQGTLGAVNDDGFPEPSDFIDPLANPAQCQRDLPLLKQLGVNALRVYTVDATLNHDGCMNLFSQNGIYAIVDLSAPVNGSIDRSAPQWTTNLLNLYLNTIDTFSKYDNVIAFNVGNEVVTGPPGTIAAPFIKAAARDVKAYLKSKGSSALVAYSSTDGPAWRNSLAAYLSCGSEETSLDLYGLNNYEWKGDSDIGSYSNTNAAFQNYNIPAYFSEFGSNSQPPRLFTEVAALFGPQMAPIWSGGLVFSYFPSLQDGFALVNLATDGSVTPTDDFGRLQTQYTAVQNINDPAQAASPASTYPACAPPDGVNFLGSTTLPPTPNQGACDCAAQKAFSCVFTPQTTNTSVIIGQLLDFTCQQLGQLGLTACNSLGADGAAGTYGLLSACDPATKLSYAMSAFYEATQRNPQSCNFAGNASVNANAPATATAVEAAASSCLANAQSTFTPTSPTNGPGVPVGGTSKNNTGSSGPKDGAAGSLVFGGGLPTLVAMWAGAVLLGVWTVLA